MNSLMNEEPNCFIKYYTVGRMTRAKDMRTKKNKKKSYYELIAIMIMNQ